jgi:hypothetical protein
MYRAVFAGTGSGKTIAGIFECLRWLLENDGIVGYVFEPSYPMVRRILIPTLENELLLGKPIEANPLVKSFSQTENRIDFRTGPIGSRLWFGSLEEPERAEGPNIDFCHVDEARLVRNFETAWQVIIRRLRGSNSTLDYPRGAWVTTTPDAPNSALHKFFENPNTRNVRSKVYRWSIYDNPKLPKDFVAEVEKAHTGGLAERFIYGRFAIAGGGSIPFDATLHMREIERSRLAEVRYGCDFGWTNPTAVVAVGYDGDGRAYVLDELYQSQLRTEDLISAIQELYKRFGVGKVFCDATSPETIDALKRSGILAEPNTVNRVDGLRELGSRFAKASDGQPRIFVSAKCVNLVSEIMEYNENIKERDHAVDALRYSLKVKPQGDIRAFKIGR